MIFAISESSRANNKYLGSSFSRLLIWFKMCFCLLWVLEFDFTVSRLFFFFLFQESLNEFQLCHCFVWPFSVRMDWRCYGLNLFFVEKKKETNRKAGLKMFCGKTLAFNSKHVNRTTFSKDNKNFITSTVWETVVLNLWEHSVWWPYKRAWLLSCWQRNSCWTVAYVQLPNLRGNCTLGITTPRFFHLN